MTRAQLRATAFRGDPDVNELRAFFQPAHQFAGDTLWSFGTSLKSAYVNSFEFMNHAPVVQLWRDTEGAVQAVSRISLGTGEWFHLATPEYRRDEVTETLVVQSGQALALLTALDSWTTVRYQSDTAGIELLERLDYLDDGIVEVFMVRSLVQPIEPAADRPGVRVQLLDTDDTEQLHQRALAQVDAFSASEPTAAETAWIGRTLPHQLSYGGSGAHPGVVAVDDSGAVLAFADIFVDHINLIGEFEPVGTRRSTRRTGLAQSVLTRGLRDMRELGMTQAIVRTGADNQAAIAAYESVGFETADRLLRFRTARPVSPTPTAA